MQLDYSQKVLLVSTLQRSLLFHMEEKSVKQIGTQPRKRWASQVPQPGGHRGALSFPRFPVCHLQAHSCSKPGVPSGSLTCLGHLVPASNRNSTSLLFFWENVQAWPSRLECQDLGESPVWSALGPLLCRYPPPTVPVKGQGPAAPCGLGQAWG